MKYRSLSYFQVVITAMSLSCSGEKSSSSDTGLCRVSDTGTEQCPLEDCAASCERIEDGVACCVATYGRGLTEDAEATLLEGCSGDACDPGLYLSREAAVCAAQVQGMSPGIGHCGGSFWTTDAGSFWLIYNVTDLACQVPGDSCMWGEFLSIDALTGEHGQSTEYQSLVLCPV